MQYFCRRCYFDMVKAQHHFQATEYLWVYNILVETVDTQLKDNRFESLH